MARYDEDDLLSITQTLIEKSQQYIDEVLGPDRALAMRMYDGQPIGDEIPGRSQIKTSDVMDTIEWIMPSLVKIFMSSEDVVDFEPRGDEDIEQADRAKKWVNYVLQNDNEAFLLLHDWIKDGLLQKAGIVQARWDERKHAESTTLRGLSAEDVEQIKAAVAAGRKAKNEDVPEELRNAKITEETESEVLQEVIDPMTGEPVAIAVKAYDLEVTRMVTEHRIAVEANPAEEFLTLKSTKSIPHGGRFFAFRRRESLSDLREMGYANITDDMVGDEVASGNSEERAARAYGVSSTHGYDVDEEADLGGVDPSLRQVWVYYCYVKIDADGDGIAEWTYLVRTADRILKRKKQRKLYETIPQPYVFSWSPIRVPHRWCGKSIADIVIELESLKTSINRAIMDWLYLTTNPRVGIAEEFSTDDTIDDYLDNAIGGAVRMKTPGAVSPLFQPQMGQEAFVFLEYWEGQGERRTGVPRINQGMNPDSINKTASGILSIMQASAARIELIARMFAETGFKQLILGILSLSTEYAETLGQRQIRVNKETLDITAESIRGRFDLIVNVGLGTGNKEQMLMHLQNIWQKQIEMMQFATEGDKKVAVVSLDQLFNTVKEMAKNMGFRTPAPFFTDPKEAERTDMPPPPPDPKLIVAQMAQQQKQQEMQFEQQIKMREFELKERELTIREAEVGINAAEKARSAIGP